MTLRSGKTVELKDGDFVRIKHIFQHHQTTAIIFHGPLLRRTNELDGCISDRLNETCWIEEVSASHPDEITYSSLQAVRRIRQLRMTNQVYENLNVSHTLDRRTSSKILHEEGILFCRLKFVTIYEGPTGNIASTEKFIRTLTPDEADTPWAEDPKVIRQRYQEEHHQKSKSGQPSSDGNQLSTSSRAAERRTSSDDLTEVRKVFSLNVRSLMIVKVDSRPPYTFGDVFCGAGGMSSGAQQAGLLVKWGLEMDVTAGRTYQLNFTTAFCENASVFDFVNPLIFTPEEYRVDVLHVSPPCQSFSPMQTTKGADFEDKQAVILSIDELVKMIRPRMITMEETFGLLFEKNIAFFNTVVRTLNDHGFSVRWKIVNFAHYGTPQSRRRLVLIAAGYVTLYTSIHFSHIFYPTATLLHSTNSTSFQTR